MSPARPFGPRILAVIALSVLAAGCASQIDAGVAKEAGSPGFLMGMWHGFVFPVAFVGSLFNHDIAVYAVPNKGTFYDVGFFIGITVFGGGSVFGSKKAKR